MPLPEINLKDYHYTLPDHRIAKYPLENRDHSRLLHYAAGSIDDKRFYELPDLLPKDALLVFNNTRVIPARLIFQKETGAQIEIFLLQPLAPSTVIPIAMETTAAATWQCMIGNAKRWKEDQKLTRELTINHQTVTLTASRKEGNAVQLEWTGADVRFVDIVEAAGQVPLPPYLNRKATDEDKPRYQTVYSKKEGAVAAPTAGLHFTDEVLQNLSRRGIHQEYLTLHVSAGTFQPIKVDDVTQHPMHSEQIIITLENINRLMEAEKIIVVGTTSMRTLESLYWYGVKILNGNTVFSLKKLVAYQSYEHLPSREESLAAVKNLMLTEGKTELIGETEIFIFPGYEFKMCDGLITNFHQPGSTLILLIAAFVGEDWKKIYDHALSGDYRFLSYGDSSLLVPKR